MTSLGNIEQAGLWLGKSEVNSAWLGQIQVYGSHIRYDIKSVGYSESKQSKVLTLSDEQLSSAQTLYFKTYAPDLSGKIVCTASYTGQEESIPYASFALSNASLEDGTISGETPVLSTVLPSGSDTVYMKSWIQEESHIEPGSAIGKVLNWRFMKASSQYVQDGLICWYDGIDNDGVGQHSSSTTTWKNLGSLGSTYDATRSSGSWQSNGAMFTGKATQYFQILNQLMSSQMKGEWTYEIVFTPTSAWFQNYRGLLGRHSNTEQKGIVCGQSEDETVQFSTYPPSQECWKASRADFLPYVNTLNTIACAASTTSGISYVWHNGVLRNTLTGGNFLLKNQNPLCIGAAKNEPYRTFDGVIHCVRIYNRQLSENEHLQNRKLDLQRFSTDADINAVCFTAEQANSTVRLDKNGSPDAISLETSTDGSTWTDYSWTSNTGDTLTLANVGDKVYMRAKTENTTIGSSTSNYYNFVMTGKIAASGSIQTLLKADGSRTDAPAYCYVSMFKNCTSLTTAPALPATTLASWCYGFMFQYCTSLTAAPILPATIIDEHYCYINMFYGSTSLSSVEVKFSNWQKSLGVTSNWLKDVAASGTFKCPTALGTNETIDRGVGYCPAGWTVVNIDAE